MKGQKKEKQKNKKIKDKKTKRKQKEKRQKDKRESHIEMSGQFRTLAMFLKRMPTKTPMKKLACQIAVQYLWRFLVTEKSILFLSLSDDIYFSHF